MTVLTQQYELKNVDWLISGAGDARDGNTTVSVNGVSGKQKFAFLYWGELNFSGSSNNQITLDGTPISGTRLGTSVDTCWGSDQSIGYFADVSDIVSGDGTYAIDGMGQGGQGASLVVFYDDGDATNNRDVTLFAGNDSTNQPGAVTTINLGNLDYESGNVTITLNVGDGQSFTDGSLNINNTLLGTNQFPGGNGALWDVKTYDITSALSQGENSLQMTHISEDDCLQFVSAIVDKPSKPPVLLLDFDTKIPMDYYVQFVSWLGLLGLDNRETSATRAGTEPLGAFTAAQKAQLVTLVQDIFDRSGIAMDVTSTKPASGDYHSVRFTSTKLRYDTNGDGTDNARLLGQAFQGVDRYNTEKNNIVAVLMDGADPLLSVAETVAHEGAHAFGARHINPTAGSGSEVMDYDGSGLETFVNTVANISEPPVDGQPATTITHNPSYHIRRYVNEESDTQLRLEGLMPGTWDRSFFNNILYSLGLTDLTENLGEVYALVLGKPPLVEGDPSPLGTLVPIGQDIDGSGTLNFSLPEGSEFRIVATSGDDGNIDTALMLNPNAADPFKITADSQSNPTGQLVTDDGTGTPTPIANAALSVDDVEEIQDAPPLPGLSVTIDRDFASESDTDPATVTITRDGDTTGDLKVILSSTDTSAATLPGEAVIPDGQASVDVDLTMVNDSRGDGLQTTTILALAEGYETGSRDFNVLDDEIAPIIGTDDPDSLAGTAVNDFMRGLDGDDTLTGNAGDDHLEGGAGLDTGAYSGDQSSYTLTLSATSTTITDRRLDGDGTDNLIDMEFLDFESGVFDPFDLTVFGGPTTLSQENFESFIELYIAYFNRAPDAIGLNFWGTAFANGTSLEEMAALFAPQDETLETYPEGTSNEDFAFSVYQNVLGRDPDIDGFNFWVGHLDAGNVSRDQFILKVLEGAKAGWADDATQEFIDQKLADRVYLENKVDIGAYFAVHKGMSDVDDAADAMAFFGDQDTSDINGAVAAIDNFYTDALDPTQGEFLMPLVGVLDDPFAMA